MYKAYCEQGKLVIKEGTATILTKPYKDCKVFLYEDDKIYIYELALDFRTYLTSIKSMLCLDVISNITDKDGNVFASFNSLVTSLDIAYSSGTGGATELTKEAVLAVLTGEDIVGLMTGADVNKLSYYSLKAVPGSTVVLTSISINNGDVTTNSTAVSVVLVYTGIAEEYMISESATFVGASWTAFTSSPISFTLSSGSADKTVYVKLRNGFGNVSATRSDTITYEYISSKVVVSFANPGNYNALDESNSYATVGADTINYIPYASVDGYNNKNLKNTLGVVKGKFVVRPAEYPTEEGITITGVDTYNSPTLTGNTGAYPDAYITTYWNSAANTTTSTNRSVVCFNSFEQGNYKVRVLISSTDNIQASGMIKANTVSGSTGAISANNVSIFVELTDIPVASDGLLNLWFWNTAGVGYQPGFNLIEIIKLEV